MAPLLFMFPVGAIVGAIVGAHRNRTRDGAILGLLLAFVGVIVVVCMEPKPVARSPRLGHRHAGSMSPSVRPAS